MNNRNTYLGKPKITNPNIERTTFNPHTSVTKQHPQQKPNAQQQNEMITKILDAVGKFDHISQNQAISRESLKNGSGNAFYQIFAIFLRSIDGCYKRDGSNYEAVISILSAFGYRGLMNKMIFVPIGAPHTWANCLAILEWISELANYSFAFQAALQERAFSQDQYSLTLSSFNSKNDEAVTNFIHSNIEQLQSQISKDSYTIQSKRMAIKNQHLAQKQLSLVERQLQKQRELLYRMSQQKMQMQGAIKQCDIAYRQKEEQLEQALEKQNSYLKALENLKYQITHQELPPDQCQKIKREIRDIKNKVHELQYSILEMTDQQNNFHNECMQKFIDRSSNLRKMADKLKGNSLFQDSELKPQLPSLNHNELNELIKKSFAQCNIDMQKQSKLQEVFKQREFNLYFKKQQQFTSRYETKFMRQEQDLLEQQRQFYVLQSKQKKYQQNIQHLKESKRTKMSKTSQQTQARTKLQKQINQLNYQISSITHQYNLKKEDKIHAINQTKEIFAQFEECRAAMAQAQQRRKEILQNKAKKLAQHKIICIQKLQSYKKALSVIVGRNRKRFQQSN